jgi:uncharacterized protein YgbK (DUF1537 family)
MENLPVLNFAETMAGLPAQQPDDGLDEAIRKALAARYDVVIVLDDDPTGTQTVYDVPVVTEWTVEAIRQEIRRDTELFYLLTNSRALSTADMEKLLGRVGRNIRKVCDELNKRFIIIIRGDSTLRGHFPEEEDELCRATGFEHVPHFIIPAFFEGGRYTINDVHYVREGERLLPAGQTPFAKDDSFGYRSSNLKEWVEEKTEGGISANEVLSISIDDLRSKVPLPLKEKLESLPAEAQVIINAADYTDLKRAALAILSFTRFLQLRTSASFIKALLGQPDRPLLKLKRKAEHGGLIVVGSHVPKTTEQLAHLQSNANLSEYEVDVRALLFEKPALASCDLAQKISKDLLAGKDVLLFTSREVIITEGADANLDIAAKVSTYLEEVVAGLEVQPSFLLTKGGITSSRIATESLGVKRALALGQVQAGVPTWELGPESKFPNMPFIIYPGNVGGEDALTSIMQNTIL